MDRAEMPGEAAVIAEFLDLYADERARGNPRSLAEYQRHYEGYEEAIARSFRELVKREAPPPLKPGAIGPYRLIRELGRGGQGTVWLAEDQRLSRRVALKILEGFGSLPPQALARFRREAEIASRLDDPGICPVYEAGTLGSVAWIAMRHVEGETLAQRVVAWRERSPRRPPRSEAIDATLAIFEKAARALHVAHEAGVLHRDIKPSNLMVTHSDEPVILDFGLARDTREKAISITRSGDLFGTPAYMAPELIDPGKGLVDRRADVWALGASLYECATLERPFSAPSQERLTQAILRAEPEDPRRHSAAISRDLAAVLGMALSKELDRRYQTALELADDLRRLRKRQPVHARPAGPALRLRRFAQRNPAIAVGILVAAFGLTAGLLTALASLSEVRRERDEKVEAVRRYEQLSDAVVVAELLSEIDDLWPRRPRRLAAMRSWLDRADDALQRERLHRAQLAALKRAGEPDGPGAAPIFTKPEDRWRHGVLAKLTRDLGRLREVQQEIEARADFAASVRGATIERHRDRWNACVRDIAANPVYRGLRLEPQVGLVPLSPDPKSGLWEFWHPGSGARPKPRASDSGRQIALAEDSGLVFTLLPGGTYWMGAQSRKPSAPAYDSRARADETPVRVKLAPFFISKYEMTQGQWLRLARKNPSTASPERSLYGTRATLVHPVEQVPWSTAQRMLARWDLALPTEAQWEYACRAGTRTPWSCGDAQACLAKVANLADRSFATAQPGAASLRPEPWSDGFAGHAPVGSLRPNAFGLHDMHGNVAEWCLDAHALEPAGPRAGDGLRGEVEGPVGIARGGSFFTSAGPARSAARLAPRRTNAAVYLGLRPVLDIDE